MQRRWLKINPSISSSIKTLAESNKIDERKTKEDNDNEQKNKTNENEYIYMMKKDQLPTLLFLPLWLPATETRGNPCVWLGLEALLAVAQFDGLADVMTTPPKPIPVKYIVYIYIHTHTRSHTHRDRREER